MQKFVLMDRAQSELFKSATTMLKFDRGAELRPRKAMERNRFKTYLNLSYLMIFIIIHIENTVRIDLEVT